MGSRHPSRENEGLGGSIRIDDELERFAAQGAEALPDGDDGGRSRMMALIFCTARMAPGLCHPAAWRPGNSGNWGYQVPALLRSGRRVVVIDSRVMAAARGTASPIPTS